MFKRLLIECFKNSKWVIILLVSLVTVVGLWIGCSWTLGWLVNKIINSGKLSLDNYITVGSYVLSFVMVIQVITVALVVWFLLSWSKARIRDKNKDIGAGR